MVIRPNEGLSACGTAGVEAEPVFQAGDEFPSLLLVLAKSVTDSHPSPWQALPTLKSLTALTCLSAPREAALRYAKVPPFFPVNSGAQTLLFAAHPFSNERN